MNEDQAPFCPVSYDQDAENPRGTFNQRGTAPIKLPVIPLSTDLPSLIRAVNITRDILRTLTTSLTVNNFYGGRMTPSKKYGKRDYLMSDYFSEWYQTKIETKAGFVGKNPKQRAFVDRINSVELRNYARDNDQSLFWRYVRALDGEGDGQHVFEEDFFERVVQVHWAASGPSGPSAPSGISGPTYGPSVIIVAWGGNGGPNALWSDPDTSWVEAQAAANPNFIWGLFGHNYAYKLNTGTNVTPINQLYNPWGDFTPGFTWNIIYCIVSVVAGPLYGQVVPGLSISPAGGTPGVPIS